MSMKAGDGERSAATGLSGQYRLAARLVLANLPTFAWVRVADPAAGIADDFQWETTSVRHALQAKWSQYPRAFAWSDLLGASRGEKSLFVGLVEAWRGLRSVTAGTLRVHLCSNNVASTATPPTGSPLAGATAEGPRHFAAFLARAVVPTRRRIDEGVERWAELASCSEVEQWSAAWEAPPAGAPSCKVSGDTTTDIAVATGCKRRDTTRPQPSRRRPRLSPSR